MCKLFQVSIFCMMTLIVSQTTVLASESDWDLVTRKDEFTGKNSPPFLMYTTEIPETANGKLELQVVCSSVGSASNLNVDPDQVIHKTNLQHNDEIRFINYVLTVFRSPLILMRSEVTEYRHVITEFRQLIMDKRQSPDYDTVAYYRNSNFNNVFHTDTRSNWTRSNYTNLPKKQEVAFVGGMKMNIEFGQKYLTFVKSCFVGRDCLNEIHQSSICTP